MGGPDLAKRERRSGDRRSQETAPRPRRRALRPRRQGFALEEFLFAFESPTITGQGAVGANDAMAGDHDGGGIGGAGAGDGADRARLAEGASDLRVRARDAARDSLKFLPDAALK